MESQAKQQHQHHFSIICQNSTPRSTSGPQNSLFPSSMAPGHHAYVSTQQHLHGLNYNRGSASGRGPIGGHWRLNKRQRQKHVQHWQHFTRAHSPGGRSPAKFGFQPIKLQLYPLAHTYPANYVRVHFRSLRVYKDSQTAHRTFQVRVS